MVNKRRRLNVVPVVLLSKTKRAIPIPLLCSGFKVQLQKNELLRIQLPQNGEYMDMHNYFFVH